MFPEIVLKVNNFGNITTSYLLENDNIPFPHRHVLVWLLKGTQSFQLLTSYDRYLAHGHDIQAREELQQPPLFSWMHWIKIQIQVRKVHKKTACAKTSRKITFYHPCLWLQMAEVQWMLVPNLHRVAQTRNFPTGTHSQGVLPSHKFQTRHQQLHNKLIKER